MPHRLGEWVAGGPHPAVRSKRTVLAVQPAGDDCGDKELRAVGVGAGVGHGQEARASVLHLEVLVREPAKEQTG
eukprot:351963-Chlamydomonas_euryale.AAC.6